MFLNIHWSVGISIASVRLTTMTTIYILYSIQQRNKMIIIREVILNRLKIVHRYVHAIDARVGCEPSEVSTESKNNRRIPPTYPIIELSHGHPNKLQKNHRRPTTTTTVVRTTQTIYYLYPSYIQHSKSKLY